MPLLHFNGIPIQGAVALFALGIATSEVHVALKSRGRPGSNPVRYGWFGFSAAFLIAGLVFSGMDLRRSWCDPQVHHPFGQGHALWHWLAAIGIGFSYLLYRPLFRTQLRR